MNFMELANERYSVRKFSGQPIEKEKLDNIIKAGHLAPTAVNFQPQRILVINEETSLEKLKECTTYHFDCTAAILVCYDKRIAWKRKFDGKSSGDIDASIVTTHMMMEAAELGIGSTWVMYFDPEKIKEIYQVPDHYEVTALLVMGYPAEEAKPSEKHISFVDIDKIVFYGEFPEMQ